MKRRPRGSVRECLLTRTCTRFRRNVGMIGNVEDVIAVEVRLADGGHRFFVTWGRIQHPVDPDPVCAVVMQCATAGMLGGEPVAARLCSTLREAAESDDAPWFYEALVSYSRSSMPFGEGYEAWRERMADEMERGKQIYYCGRPEAA